ncbi:MAG: hypothetical protein QM726_15610 [Chitinophagaceae bacterium]
MKQEELQKLIEQLEKQIAEDKASFGIFHYGAGTGESYIQADPEGLKRFALELLKAANEMSDDSGDNKDIIHLNFHHSWLNEHSDTFIQYIEPANKNTVVKPATETVSSNQKESLTVKFMPYGCFIALAVVLIALLVGLWTLAKWIF